MPTAEYDVNSFSDSAQTSEDATLLVKFLVKSRQDTAASAREGRAVFHDVEYVDIKIPGKRGGGVCRPATFVDKNRFARHYEAFKARIELPMQGTPLVEWAMISRSQADELSFSNVKTVEQLAAISDNHAQNFRGIYALKAKAKAYLDNAGSAGTLVDQLREELKGRDAKIDKLMEQVDALMAGGQAASTPAPKTKAKAKAKPKSRSRSKAKANVKEKVPVVVGIPTSALDEVQVADETETETETETVTDDSKPEQVAQRRARR